MLLVGYVSPPLASTRATSALSLHDALPISLGGREAGARLHPRRRRHELEAVQRRRGRRQDDRRRRSEEHTSELQSLTKLVCRLLLAKNKKPLRRPAARTRYVAARNRRRFAA